MGEKSCETATRAWFGFMCVLSCRRSPGVWLLGFRTRATSVGDPGIEPQVICRAKSKHRLDILD